MKRILITGMNTNQTTKDYYLRQELQVVASHYSLIRCLEAMGFEVEHRHVTVGEDLSAWDEVIVFLHSPKGYCQRLFAGFWAVHARPDCILAFDDWQTDQIMSSIKLFRAYFTDNNASYAFRAYTLDIQKEHYTEEFLAKHTMDFVHAIDTICSKQNRLLISAFAGGDIDKLRTGWPRDRIFTYNPNPYHLNRRPDNNYGRGVVDMFGSSVVSNEAKKREWNFSSLVQNKTRSWLDRQGVTWPVNIYGGRRGENQSERVTEDTMCEIYAQQWGCLMPGYFHRGSGWWRARPLQVADAGSILVCDDDEGRVYGEAYVGLRARDVESKDLDGLVALARQQRDCLYSKHPLDKATERAELQAILDARK